MWDELLRVQFELRGLVALSDLAIGRKVYTYAPVRKTPVSGEPPVVAVSERYGVVRRVLGRSRPAADHLSGVLPPADQTTTSAAAGALYRQNPCR
jgi:hypothetical protein